MSSILVTRTKIILPQRRKELLTRPRLIEQLFDQLDYKLTFVIAPAGYGKTSLLLDFSHQVDLPVCWYSLDTFDQSLLRFIAHFVAAIKHIFPAFGEQATIALDAANQLSPDINHLVTVIVNDIFEHIQEHFLFVLDDYHLVSSRKEIIAFTNQFIREVSENCHLVLSSRTLLSLPDLPLLTARMQVGGLGYQELAFLPGEIQSLVLQNYHVSVPDDTAQELSEQTEGWITGLLLTTQTRWQKKSKPSAGIQVSGVGLYDFLAQQVLDQQPVQIREFLMQTSFLEEYDENLCQAVWGNSDSYAGCIDSILKDNLFVLPVGEEGQTIRYHHLFRDFLQNRFEQEHPKDLVPLLQRIADTYISQEEWEKAYAIYQRIDNKNATADLVERVGSIFIRDSRLEILSNWVDALPGEILEQRPTLLSHKGAVLIMKGQVEKGLAYLDQAEGELRRLGPRIDLASTLARMATAHRFLGNYTASLADGYEALAICEQNENLQSIKAEALRAIGMSLYHLGKLSEAIEKFTLSLDEYSALQELPNVALVHMELGMCLRSAGNFRQALEHYKLSLNYWRKVNNTIRLSGVLNNMGVLYHLTGDYIHAVELFEEALEHARRNNLMRNEAYLLCGIGDLYMELDAETNAQDAYHRSREIAEQIDDRFLLLYISVVEAAQARVKGSLNQALIYLQMAKDLAQKSASGYETALWRLEAGQIDLAARNPQLAITHLTEATRLFVEGGQIVEAAQAYLILANAFHTSKDMPASLSALDQALNLSADLDSRHALVVTGRDLQSMLRDACQDARANSAAALVLNQIQQFERQLPSLRRSLRPKASTILFAPPKITIRALGGATVELDGKPVNSLEWINQKRVRELFFYLVMHPDGKTRDEIGLDLWPESSPAQLKLQFKNTIYRLRYALGQDIILFDGADYFFNQDLDYDYDARVLEEKYYQAKSLDAGMEQISCLRAVVDLYRGPYLPESDSTWVMIEREKLRQIYVNAILALGSGYLASGDYHTALEFCHTILREDACLEEAHRIAMQAYAALGDRAAVKRQFNQCCYALRQDIESEPSPQTNALYQTLISN